MKILLTNDDGIRAPGIIALHKSLRGLGELIVIAPKTIQSAMSHGITYTTPLMTEQVEITEGMSGISPRYVINRLSAVLAEDGVTAITPIDIIRSKIMSIIYKVEIDN